MFRPLVGTTCASTGETQFGNVNSHISPLHTYPMQVACTRKEVMAYLGFRGPNDHNALIYPHIYPSLSTPSP